MMLTSNWLIDINMPLTLIALNKWCGICENDINFKSTSTLFRQTIQNAMILYIFAQNKKVIITSNWPIDINMLLILIALEK